MAQGSTPFLSAEIKSLLTAGFTLGLIWGGFAADVSAQGGQTEVKKSMPAAPAPAPVQPAPVEPEAQAPQAEPSAAAPSAPDAQGQAVAAPADGQMTPADAAAAEPGQAGVVANWQADLSAQPGGMPIGQDPGALEVVQKANDYFNTMTTLQGNFVQTDPDNKQKRGKFYFERPGKVRFDYASPSRLVIVSNGEYLAIEDHDLKTTDRYPLEMTPFRLVLAEKVDLLRDAIILAVNQGEEMVVLTMEDRKGDTGGRIRLFFNKADMTLKQWITTDPQGLDTRVELADIESGKAVSANLFEFNKSLGFKNTN